MLIISGTSREQSRRDLLDQLCQARIPTRLAVPRSHLVATSLPWREYWNPCRPFFQADARLVQRLNRLKKAWLGILRRPADRLCQMRYCWRYFGLLHHTLRIAVQEPERSAPLTAIRRIIGFETFGLEALGEAGVAAGTVAERNPLFLLGQLGGAPTVPTPRQVPLLRPSDCDDIFYYYRQLFVPGPPSRTLLLSPTTRLPARPQSFIPIDRITRLVSDRADPYWKPRARLLARRILKPLITARVSGASSTSPLTVLDLGAGTGHLIAKAWTYLGKLSPADRPAVAFHFVDSNPPAFGRSFGLSRHGDGVAHVEWTTADYRSLVDDDEWLAKCGPFDWTFACRILDNASNFMIEQLCGHARQGLECLPHSCLAPRRQPEGMTRLQVSCTRRQYNGGTVLPQYSLRDYFSALQVLETSTIENLHEGEWYLPVRRFNPGCLITPSGRSLIAQLLKVSRAVIIEDVDVEPAHLKQHRADFGLAGTAAVFCTGDGFRTEARQYVITAPFWADQLKGERLW
ncbi:MAG: hypothetical protein BIFFINMI_00307 [Phycisphaerae bacterium]|nr:hypothetical protein [Phycisphaerae bacterium]